MRKYNKKKLALGGGMDQYNALDAVVGSPSPTSTSAIGAGLISKVPNSVSASGPTMGAPAAAKGSGGMSAGGYQAAASLGTGLMDAIDGGNQYGYQSSGVTIGKGALTGAATGATVGSVIPGIGTAIGAAGGAIIGGVTGLINAKKIKRKERQLFADQNVARNKYDNAVSNALSTDQGLVEGYKGASYFKMGGKILGRGLKYSTGGKLPDGDPPNKYDPTGETARNYAALYGPLRSKFDLNKVKQKVGSSREKGIAFQNALKGPTDNQMYYGLVRSPFEENGNMKTRKIPPMDATLKEIQSKLLNFSQKELEEVVTKQYTPMDLIKGNLPRGISRGDAVRYGKYLKSMGDKGYTFANGGLILPGGPIKGAPVRDLPPDNRRIRNIDSLATAWKVPTTSIMTTGLYNYGDTKANGGIPRRMDYTGPNGNQFFDYYDDVTRGNTSYNTGTLPKFANGGQLMRPAEEPLSKYISSKGSAFKNPSFTNGDMQELYNPDSAVRNWHNNYIDSPKYKERLLKFDYPDADKTIKTRLDRVKTAIIKNTNKDGGSSYSGGLNEVVMDNDEIKNLSTTRDDILAHEFSHINNSSRNYIKDPTRGYMDATPDMKINSQEEDYISSKNKNVRPSIQYEALRIAQKHNVPLSEILKGLNHDYSPMESKSDIDAFRYLLKTQGLYDAGTQDMNQEILNKIRNTKAYKNSFNSKRLEENFNDEDLIDIMNAVATNNPTTFKKARNGGTLIRPDSNLLSGPSISSQPANGGKAKPLNSQSTEMVGNSHAQGGIQLPQLEAEVEDGETTTGNFVFSKELGFAKLHRPIAKAIGKIEKKPSTPDRRNALQLLKGQEERLALSQEQYKLQNGMQ